MFKSLLFTRRRLSSTKINSSNALMESVNMAGLSEEYQQVNRLRNWAIYSFFIVGGNC